VTQDADGCEVFNTKVLIEPPIDFFGTYQYRLAFDGNLIQPIDSWVTGGGPPANGAGQLCQWNATLGDCDWIPANSVVTNPTGDLYCPDWAAATGIARGPAAGKHGCWDITESWPLTAGDGVSFVETDPAGGNYLTDIRWVTSGTGLLARCFGNAVNTGTTDIVFWPMSNTGSWGGGLLLGASDGGDDYDLEDEYDIIWVNSSVTVN